MAENKCGTGVTPLKTNMTVENPPFEDVFPIENRNFQCHVSFQGCISPYLSELFDTIYNDRTNVWGLGPKNGTIPWRLVSIPWNLGVFGIPWN